MPTTVKDRALTLSKLGSEAESRITTDMLSSARAMFRGKLPSETYYRYASDAPDISISSVELGEKTRINLASAFYKREGGYIFISSIEDDGLWELNGRHEVEPVENTGGKSFYVSIDTSGFDGAAYTSGGKVNSYNQDELLSAEAYFLLSKLIPACIDIYKGSVGLLPDSTTWGDGGSTQASVESIYRLAGHFAKKANELIESNIGDGSGMDELIIVAV